MSIPTLILGLGMMIQEVALPEFMEIRACHLDWIKDGMEPEAAFKRMESTIQSVLDRGFSAISFRDPETQITQIIARRRTAVSKIEEAG